MPVPKYKSPLYGIWQGMLGRCRNPKFKQWARYGGRGITVCPEWKDYRTFERDMSPRPPGTSLDRIDPNGNYEPGNCRWATRQEQQRNQCRTVFVMIEELKYKAIELADVSGLKVDTIVDRAAKGMTYDQVIADTKYLDVSSWRKAVDTRVAKQRAKTHCKHGHEFTPENTYVYRGCRSCRQCARNKEKRRRAA